MTNVPLLKLNNGVELPAVGLGVFQTPPAETAAAVETALEIGYRHIDTAAAYGNEREVGEGIRRSGVDRSEMFVETKVWISDYGYQETLHAFDKSAAKLGVDRLDLLILHQPLSSSFGRTLDAYKALEELLAKGKVRAIGVSNFKVEHLETLLARTEIVPAVNQIELHPYFSQRAMREFHAAHGILTQAWSPLGGITFSGQAPWVVPIPGTTQMPHLRENLGAAGVRFSPSELAELTASASAIQVRGERLPAAVQVFSDVEAPPRP